MYGLVNRAVQEMITGAYGEQVWLEIKRRAGITQEVFIGIESYPDEITYKLVAAASEQMQIPADELLHAFGEHWILKTGLESYGHLLENAGEDIGDFLAHLPHFHDRVALLYPNLIPPIFEVTDRKEQSLRLHYITHRPGLTSFVLGLLSGIGKMFAVPVKVSLEQSRGDGSRADIFLVEWTGR